MRRKMHRARQATQQIHSGTTRVYRNPELSMARALSLERRIASAPERNEICNTLEGADTFASMRARQRSWWHRLQSIAFPRSAWSQSKNSMDAAAAMVKELKALYQNVPIGRRIHDCSRWLRRPCLHCSLSDIHQPDEETYPSLSSTWMAGRCRTRGDATTGVLRKHNHQVLLGLAFVHSIRCIETSSRALLINHSGAVKVSDLASSGKWKMPMAKHICRDSQLHEPKNSGNMHILQTYGPLASPFSRSHSEGTSTAQTGLLGLLHSLRDEPSPHLPATKPSLGCRQLPAQGSCRATQHANAPRSPLPHRMQGKHGGAAPRRATAPRGRWKPQRNGQRDGQRRARSNMRARHGPKVRAMEGRGRGKARRRRPAAPLSKNPGRGLATSPISWGSANIVARV